MLGIMAVLNQKDSTTLVVNLRSGMCSVGFTRYDAPCVMFPSGAKPKMLCILAGMDQIMVQTAETVESPQLQSIQVVDISFFAKRQFSMVQTSQLTTVVPQLPFVSRWSMSLLCWSCRFTSPLWRRGRFHVQTVRRTIFSRKEHGGRCPCCAGRVCHTRCCQRQVRKARTLQKTVEVPQLQFINFVDNSVLWCRGCFPWSL